MSTTTPIVAVPNQEEITVEDAGDFIVIRQIDSAGQGDDDIYVHRRNLAALILVLRQLDGQEV